MNLELRKRATFINSLSGFKSLGLIGTQNNKGETNLALFSSLVHIGANPPYIAFINRPDVVDRHTLHNIKETGYYTINHVNPTIFKQAHQTSANYPQHISEFDATGLQITYKNHFVAPFVAESKIQLGVQFKEIVPININNTIMVIGEIVAVYFPDECLQDDGFLDIEKAQSVTCSGLDSYHTTQKLARLSYAKPDQPVSEI
jgi:flavin reductase (DIM6/NTAB) family NADH-FMN oxidoreductase RutF